MFSISLLFPFLLFNSIICSPKILEFNELHFEVVQEFESVQKLLPESVKVYIIEIINDFNTPLVDFEGRADQLNDLYEKNKNIGDLSAIPQFFWNLSAFLEQKKLNIIGINDQLPVHEFEKFKHLIKNSKWATFFSKNVNLIVLKIRLESIGSKSKISQFSIEKLIKLSKYSLKEEIKTVCQSFKEEVDQSTREIYKFYLLTKKETLISSIRLFSNSIKYGDEETINRTIKHALDPVDDVISDFNLN
jgi:hypothetical protein